jgi:hypothetical protein
MTNLAGIVSELKSHRDTLQKEIHQTDAAIRALTAIAPASKNGQPKPHGRKMSAAAKAKIAARMKKYWADRRKVKTK